MAIDFGSFINGMRMSNQDIMDRQRFEQNQKYVQSQMDTMDLARQAEQQRMKMTDMQMQQLPVQYGQENYKFYMQNTQPQLAAAFASHDTAPTAANDVLDDPDFQKARSQAGLPEITQRMLPETDETGAPTGLYKLYDTKSKKVLQGGIGAGDATRQSAKLLDAEWALDPYQIATMRAMRGGMYRSNTTEMAGLRASLGAAQKQLSDATAALGTPQAMTDPTYRSQLMAERERARQDVEDLTYQISQTSPTFNAMTGGQGPVDRRRADAGTQKQQSQKAEQEAADLAKTDVPKGDVSNEDGRTVITDKNGKKWTLSPTGKFYYGDTAADRYIDPDRQARREALAKQPAAAPTGALRSAPGAKKPTAKPAAPSKGNGVTAIPGGATVNGVNISF